MPPVSESIPALRRLGLLPTLGRHFAGKTEAILDALASQVLADNDAFRETRNPDIQPELKTSLRLHLESVASLLAESSFSDEHMLEYARLRARQRFPLEAELGALRCLNRCLADEVRNAAIEVADSSTEIRQVVAATAAFAIEYTGVAGSLTTQEYVAETRRLAETEADKRSELLQMLLEGYDEADNRAARLLRRAGYLQQRQTYCVVVIRATRPSEMDNAARVERILESLQGTLRKLPARQLSGIRKDAVVAIVSATQRLSGWTRPHTVVSELVYEPLRLLGPSVLVGVSTDVPSTSHIPRALDEATEALQRADVAQRVVRFATIPFVELLIGTASDRQQLPLPVWVEPFQAADRKAKLERTLRAYADNDMNVLKTAEALDIHSNTIYARMQRIEDLTGLNPRQYHALTELLLATECARR